MIVAKNLIMDANNNVLFSVTTDSEQHAKDIRQDSEATGGWTEERTMKCMLSVPVYVYQEWVDRLGVECWNDREFLKWFTKHRPEFAY